MTSASECHSCGRCAGQRDAVTYSARSPFSEILDFNNPANAGCADPRLRRARRRHRCLPMDAQPVVPARQAGAADWLVEHDHFALLDNDVPWWLLTHYPEASDLFTWLDGALILAYLLGGGFLLGSLLLIGPAIAARCGKPAPHLATLHPGPRPSPRPASSSACRC
jgi:hypothetical protein